MLTRFTAGYETGILSSGLTEGDSLAQQAHPDKAGFCSNGAKYGLIATGGSDYHGNDEAGGIRLVMPKYRILWYAN